MNALLHEVLAEALERVDDDERLGMQTVTGVECDPDLRHATVFLSSLNAETATAIEEHRRELQAAIAAEVRLKRVPVLRFVVDPAVVAGTRVEEAIARSRRPTQQ